MEKDVLMTSFFCKKITNLPFKKYFYNKQDHDKKDKPN